MSIQFATGAVAEGVQFIGRHMETEKVFQFFYRDRKNVALVGLPRIGKTSIAMKVCHDIEKEIKNTHENSLLLMLDLASEQSFATLWYSIILKLYDQVSDLGIQHRVLDREYQWFSETADQSYNKLKPHAELFLSRLRKLGVHVFLIIDEFDDAVRKFQGERHYYEFFRDIASTNNYDLNLMLISRQLIKQIEANAYGNSTLFGIFDDITVREFSENDMEAYYNILTENGCEQIMMEKDALAENAGRNPYLLSIFGDRMVDMVAEKERASIETIYKMERTKIISYFEALKHQMENDNNLVYVLEIIIGPRYKISKTDVDMLDSMGYLSHHTVINLEGEEEEVWQVVSDAFTNYLHLNCTEQNVWPELMETLHTLVALMKVRLPKLYHISPEPVTTDEFNSMLDKGHSSLSNDLYKNYVKANKRRFDKDSTYLDVAGFWPLAAEMKKYWDDSEYGFRYLFDNKPFEYWVKHFERLHDSRDACAHDHPDFLTEMDIKTTNLYCRQLQEVWNRNKNL